MSGPSELLLPAGTTLVVPTDDGAELAVTDLGTGPLVVLAHGWTEQRETWSLVVRRLLDAGCRVVLYDQRGHGSSTSGSDGFTIPRLAGDLRAVLEAVDARDAVLVGHSMGGMTIMSLAKEHPEVLAERARGIALVATAASALGGSRADAVLVRLMAAPWFIRLFRSPLGPWLVRRTFGRSARPEHRRLTREHFVATASDARQGWLEAMGTMDLTTALGTIAMPTVVLSGTRDTLTPPKHADRMVAGIPGSRLVSYEGLGHQLQYEAPDAVVAEIRSLLAAAPAAGAASSSTSPGHRTG
ncbi:MAG: putative hydrolase [Actinomycetia bacterium]|nr:putative hydrolase [Actinomycetes bacterium]